MKASEFVKMLVKVQTLWLGIIFHTISGMNAIIYEEPINVAIETGQSITLPCAVNGSFTGWMFQNSDSSVSGYVINPSCNRAPTINPSCSYNTTSTLVSGVGRCYLNIISATPSCAGYYICYEVDAVQNTRSSEVIVIDSGPHCSTNASNTTKVDDSSPVVLSCNASYTSPFNRPQLNWFSQQSSQTIYTNNTAHSTLTVANPIPLIPSDTCILNFSAPGNQPLNNASNAPSYTSNCATPNVFPYYCPLHVNISGAGNGSVIGNGTTLSCSAEANPLASNIEWQLTDENRTEISLPDRRSPTIQVFSPGYYTCNITNDLPGCYRTATLYISDEPPIGDLFFCDYTDNSNHGCYMWECATAHCCNCAGCIVVEILWPCCVFLLGIWIFVCVRHPKGTNPVTWWADKSYICCLCWCEACCCETKNHTI